MMPLSFSTPRLAVVEITPATDPDYLVLLLRRIPDLLTPAVVENLPPYFHGVNTHGDARVWYERIRAESRLFVVKIDSGSDDVVIGFLFVFSEQGTDAQIGYLLGESYWGKGLASELLTGFIAEAATSENWQSLTGGVAQDNVASANLLKKLGFAKQPNADDNVVFYTYTF